MDAEEFGDINLEEVLGLNGEVEEQFVAEGDDLLQCKEYEVYQGGSAQDVSCVLCHSTETSGSWRRGWPVLDGNQNANLCNRCGQRWAKLGKTTCLQTIRNGIKRGFQGTDSLEPKKQFPEHTFSSKHQTDNSNSMTVIQGQQKYIGYAIQKLSDGKSTYALFWLMDYQEDFLLVALGVDSRSSGHFTYQHAPSLPENVQPLKCTNRSQTLDWISFNFGVRKQLPSTIGVRIPKLGIPQVTLMLAQQKVRRTPGATTVYTETAQYLCLNCGCNHPSEECTMPCISPTLIHNISAHAAVQQSADQELPAMIQHEDHLSLGGFCTKPILDSNDASPTQDTLFVTTSPVDYDKDYEIGSTRIPNPSMGIDPHLAPGSSNHPSPRLDQVLPRGGNYMGNGSDIVNWTTTLPQKIVEDAFQAWAQLLHSFSNGQAHVPSMWHPGMHSKPGVQEVIAVLHQLICCSNINFELLERSQISKSVALLCQHNDPTVATRARQLVYKWRASAVAALGTNN